MKRRLILLIVGAIGLAGLWSDSAQAQFSPSTYDVSFTSTQAQEDILKIFIHQECARLLSSGQSIQTYCTQQAPPNDQTCVCTPTVTEKRTFLVQRYLVGGFVTDRQALYLSHGRDVGRLYSTADKATRDVIDSALGLESLP